MIEKSKLIDVILNDCTPNTTRKYRPDGSDTPAEANPTQHEIMVGYSLAGGYYRGLDVGKVVEEMIARKLIVEKQEGRLYTDSLGYDVLDMGGWDKYQQLTWDNIEKERYSIKLLKRQVAWFWGGVAISVLVPVITITYQVTTANKTQYKIDTLQQQIDSLWQTHSNQTNIHQTTIQKADTVNSKYP